MTEESCTVASSEPKSEIPKALNLLYFSVGVSTSAIKMASTRLPSPKSLVSAPTQILAQFPKQHQQSPKQQLQQVQQQTQQPVAQPSSVSQQQQQPQQSPLPPGIKPTIQIKQESGNWKNARGLLFYYQMFRGFCGPFGICFYWILLWIRNILCGISVGVKQL